MESVAIYLIKSCGLLLLFFVAYHFLLRKETFFTANRWFLLAGLITATVLPFVVFTTIIWIEPTPVNYDWSSLPIRTVTEENHTEEYIYLGLALTYSLITLGLLTKFGFDFYSLRKIFKGKTIERQADFKFIDTTENIAPFSYFNTIVYNSSLYSTAELENILEHEKVHCEQNHTVDVLIGRVFCAIFWFNPFIWLYKKAILQNLEFIADSVATRKLSDKKAYQLTLLKITTHENCVAITNHFYQSLIKKRIVMLNKNQSSKRNSWKYAIILPALVAFVLFFQIEVIAQQKESHVSFKSSIDKAVLEVNSNSTEEALNVESKLFKQEFDLDVNFSNIKVNSEGHIIAINVVLQNNKGAKKVYLIEEESPIKPFAIFVEKEKSGSVNFGFQANAKENAHLSQHFNHINKSQNASDTVQPRHAVISDVQQDKSWSLNSMSKDGREYLIVLNGRKQVKGIPLKISFDEDFDTQNILDPEEAMLKYGEFGKDGVWEITTKKIKNPKKAQRKKNSKKPLLVVNGQVAGNQTTADDIDPNTIEAVNVLKEEEATAKYGKAAKNGAIEITEKENKGWGISFGISKPEENISRIQNNKNVDYKKAVIVINGKISDYETLDKLKPEEIVSVGVQKPSNGPESTKQIALKKYGEKALNGVVEIETKEFRKK
ncbi:M56 family metallopeptidase [Flavobacterium xanthum]|uniref:TonB-dependent Receptor Plug Domain n=1 Tax=Flavobacterium xanthum TaxID=69322 RepID=A0A1M7KKC6_9FLAO|nr:M56 family metallopeptidase [Flavobacterium xanthum]SHM65726.1 TonB-dependent Receptor Plug Domain [Flavobacterium xanthum]